MIQYEDTIKIFQKNTYSCELNITNENGDPVNLEGQLFSFIVKLKDDCLTKDINAKINKSYILSGTEAQQGKFTLTLNKDDTDLEKTILNKVEYVGQFQIENNGVINTLKQVNFIIEDNKKKE